MSSIVSKGLKSMTNYDKHILVKQIKLEDRCVPQVVFRKTDERCTSNFYVQWRLFESLNFKECLMIQVLCR